MKFGGGAGSVDVVGGWRVLNRNMIWRDFAPLASRRASTLLGKEQSKLQEKHPSGKTSTFATFFYF